MPAIAVPPVATAPATQRPKNHHEKDDPDQPIRRAKQASHRRLQMGDGDQQPLDDDGNRRQPENSGQMRSICSLHRML
jgi:hypothetical protein